jgi:hypothetical protein
MNFKYFVSENGKKGNNSKKIKDNQNIFVCIIYKGLKNKKVGKKHINYFL